MKIGYLAKSLLLISFTIWLFSSCTGYYLFKKAPDWWMSKEEVAGNVVKVFHGPETVFTYEYVVGGKTYSGKYYYYTNMESVVVGSKYIVVYNPLNPEQNYILLHKPVFETNEEVGYTIAYIGVKGGKGVGILPAPGFSEDSVLRFNAKYSVDGVVYKSVLCYVLNDKGLDVNEVNDHRFRVKYWVQNPYRCMVLLDQPVD